MSAMIVLRVLTHPNGLVRVAIVRRDDGRVCLYEQGRWPEEPAWQWPSEIVADPTSSREGADNFELGWMAITGLFADAEVAEREVRSMDGFAMASITLPQIL